MISHTHQISLILFCLLMTLQFCTCIKIYNSKINMVNEELQEINNWFKANKLSINANKTNIMILGTPHVTSTKAREDLNVILDNTALERVKLTKFLSVLTDECLIWKNHINCISNTISRNIGIMYHEQTWTLYHIVYYIPFITLPKLWHTYMGKYL